MELDMKIISQSNVKHMLNILDYLNKGIKISIRRILDKNLLITMTQSSEYRIIRNNLLGELNGQ